MEKTTYSGRLICIIKVTAVASKRKQKDMKAEVPFEMPDFNEKEYLEEQLKIGKGVFVAILWAVIVGVLTYFTYTFFPDNWRYIFITGIFGLLSLYLILPPFKVDLKNIPKKSWFNFVFAYFLTWLAVAIIAVNPPFSDISDPTLEDLTLEKQEYNPGMYDNFIPTVQIRARIRDNYKVSGGTVEIHFPAVSGLTVTRISDELKKEDGEKDRYFWNMQEKDVEMILSAQDESNPLEIAYTITARDAHDNEKIKKGSFSIVKEGNLSVHPTFWEDATNPERTKMDDEDGIRVILYDNSQFKEVYFTINTKNGEPVTDDARYGFEMKSQDEEQYTFHASVADVKKGDYNITITAIDAGNNEINRFFLLNMTKNGKDVGKSDTPSGMPGFGPIELVFAFIVCLSIVGWKKKKQRSSALYFHNK